MKEIDLLSAVKFTDESGVMHLFPQEEKSQNSFLPFRYLLTKVSAPSSWVLTCTIREREFFIPDGGESIYKDLYRLDPFIFFVVSNNYDFYPVNKIEDSLELLGYSSEEIIKKVSHTTYFFKYTPIIDSYNLIILEEGQTYADAFLYNSNDNLSFWEKGFNSAIWSPDLMKGISLADFFGDENDWTETLESYDKITCIEDIKDWTHTNNIVKTITE